MPLEANSEAHALSGQGVYPVGMHDESAEHGLTKQKHFPVELRLTHQLAQLGQVLTPRAGESFSLPVATSLFAPTSYSVNAGRQGTTRRGGLAHSRHSAGVQGVPGESTHDKDQRGFRRSAFCAKSLYFFLPIEELYGCCLILYH